MRPDAWRRAQVGFSVVSGDRGRLTRYQCLKRVIAFRGPPEEHPFRDSSRRPHDRRRKSLRAVDVILPTSVVGGGLSRWRMVILGAKSPSHRQTPSKSHSPNLTAHRSCDFFALAKVAGTSPTATRRKSRSIRLMSPGSLVTTTCPSFERKSPHGHRRYPSLRFPSKKPHSSCAGPLSGTRSVAACRKSCLSGRVYEWPEQRGSQYGNADANLCCFARVPPKERPTDSVHNPGKYISLLAKSTPAAR